MDKKPNKPGRLSWAFYASAGLLLTLPYGLYAQDAATPAPAPAAAPAAPEEAMEELQEVVVTGTGSFFEENAGISPVAVVDSRDIAATGNVDILNILQKTTPGFYGSGNLGKSNANIRSGSTLGASAIAYRNLPTLVVLDGMRLPYAPALAGGAGAFVDVSQIPASLVGSIDVLQDGGSAMYGSDAISGVVNVRLKRDFEGAELGAKYAFADDVSSTLGYFIAGAKNGKTNVIVGGQAYNEDPLYQKDRGFSSPTYGTTTYGGVVRVGGLTTNADGDEVNTLRNYRLDTLYGTPSQVNPRGTAATATAVEANPLQPGLIPLQTNTYVGPQSTSAVLQGFDLSRFSTLTLGKEYRDVVALVDHALIEDRVVAYADLLVSDHYSWSQLNAQPLSNGTGLVIPDDSPYNIFDATIDGSTAKAGPGGYIVANRFTTVPRVYQNDALLIHAVGGLKGEVGEHFTYNLSYNWNKSQVDFTNPGLWARDAVNAAIAGGYDAAGNPVVGGDYSMVNGVLRPALDFFRPESSYTPQELASALNGLSGTGFGVYDSDMRELQGVVTGKVLEMPAGHLQVAAGAAYREEEIATTGDYFSRSDVGGWIGGTTIDPISVGRDVTALFGEVEIPLLGEKQDIPVLHKVDLSISARYDDYSDVGSSTVPAAGIRIEPFSSTFAIRAKYSESFVAPTLYDLFGPSGEGFSGNVVINGVPQDQAQVRTGSNPDLEPSTSENWTAGIVVNPISLKELTVTLDYYNIQQDDVVGSAGETIKILDVNTNGTASPYVNDVRIGGFDGATVTGPGQLEGNLASVYVLDTLTNLSAQKTDGIDLKVNYLLNTDNAGIYDITFAGNYTLSYEGQTLPTDPLWDYAGTYTFDGSFSQGTVPDYSLSTVVNWQFNWLGVMLGANYIPTVEDWGPGYAGVDTEYYGEIDDYLTFDAAVSFTLEVSRDSMLSFLDRFVFTVGCNNLTDEQPRLVSSDADANSDVSIYDPWGRTFYVQGSLKF